MKYYFIVNPNSGKRKKQQRFMEGLKAAAKKLGIEYQVYCTTGVGDGVRYTEEVCRQSAGAEGKGSNIRLRRGWDHKRGSQRRFWVFSCGGRSSASWHRQ